MRGCRRACFSAEIIPFLPDADNAAVGSNADISCRASLSGFPAHLIMKQNSGQSKSSDFFTMLTVAGSDSCGGAGIQADIKTACAFGVYALSVVTAVTVQGFRGVRKMIPLSPADIADQITTVVAERKPDAVKIGMLPSAEAAEEVARCIRELGLSNVVCDPVMAASSGQSLCDSSKSLGDVLTDTLFPLCTVVTPNIPEAEQLCTGWNADVSMLLDAWKCGSVLLKGGHGKGDVLHDIFVDKSGKYLFAHDRIDTVNSHGTGCTLSSAIACGLAKGLQLPAAVQSGIDFVNAALSGATEIFYCKEGGPLDFFKEPKFQTHDNLREQ